MVCKAEPCLHSGWIPEPWPDWQCKVRFCHIRPCPCSNGKKRQTCKAWAPPVYRYGFHPFFREGWWVLYRLPPCPDKYLRDKRSLSLCDISQQGRRNQTFVFQHGFSKPATVFCAWQEKAPLNQTGSSQMQYIPLFLYSFRWNIMPTFF